MKQIPINPHSPVPPAAKSGMDLCRSELYEKELLSIVEIEDRDERRREADHFRQALRHLHTHTSHALSVFLPDEKSRATALAQWRRADYQLWSDKMLGLIPEASFVWRIKDEEGRHVVDLYDKATISLPPTVGQLIDVGVEGVFFSVSYVVSSTTDVPMAGDCVVIYSASFDKPMRDYLMQKLSSWQTGGASEEATSVIQRFVPDWM